MTRLPRRTGRQRGSTAAEIARSSSRSRGRHYFVLDRSKDHHPTDPASAKRRSIVVSQHPPCALPCYFLRPPRPPASLKRAHCRGSAVRSVTARIVRRERPLSKAGSLLPL